MAQTRSFNRLDDDSTWDFNIRSLGIIGPGIYRGFDFDPSNTMDLNLGHTLTGYRFTKRDGTGFGNFTGALVSKQGVIIMEDEGITLAIEANPLPYPRIDTIVCTHRYSELEGGEQATYSVLKGNPADTPVAPGVLKDLTDVIVGTLFLPSGTVALNGNGVIWNRSKTPFLAEDGSRLPYVTSHDGNLGVVETENDGRKAYDVFLKDTRVDFTDSFIPNFNSFVQTGFYTLSAGTNAPSSDPWHYLEVHTHGNMPGSEYVSQIAHTLTAAKQQSFRRACVGGVWSPWRRLGGINEAYQDGADYNDYTDAIVVRVGGSTTHGPTPENSNDFILRVVTGWDMLYQIAVEANSPTPNVWIRTYSPYANGGAGAFVAWRRMDSAKVAKDLTDYQTANDSRVKAVEDALPKKQNVLPKGVVMEYAGPLVNSDGSAIFDGTGKGVFGDTVGWALCNGQNGTVDKRSKFTVGYDPGKDASTVDANTSGVVGYFNYGKIGNIGGLQTVGLLGPQNGPHVHTSNAMKKTSAITFDGGSSGGSAADWLAGVNSATIDSSGSGSQHENRPPYIVMGYIQKIV